MFQESSQVIYYLLSVADAVARHQSLSHAISRVNNNKKSFDQGDATHSDGKPSDTRAPRSARMTVACFRSSSACSLLLIRRHRSSSKVKKEEKKNQNEIEEYIVGRFITFRQRPLPQTRLSKGEKILQIMHLHSNTIYAQ